MEKFSTNNFFNPIKNTSINWDISDKIEFCLKIIDQMAHILNKSLYVIDYQQGKFLYVSSNEPFLCGYTKEQVTEWGYSFYKRVIPPNDLNRLFDITKAGFDFYNKLPIEKRYSYSIEFDFDLIHISKKRSRVIQRSTPLIINKEGDLCLSLCIVSPSYSDNNNTIIKGSHPGELFIYSEKTKSWFKNRIDQLTTKEQAILHLSSKGLTNIDIAKKLSLNINTVKFHKRNIFHKLDVKNCIEAITAASHWGLL